MGKHDRLEAGHTLPDVRFSSFHRTSFVIYHDDGFNMFKSDPCKTGQVTKDLWAQVILGCKFLAIRSENWVKASFYKKSDCH